MRRPSASRMALAQQCVFPWTSGLEWARDEPGPEARFGSAFHECAAKAIYGEPLDIPAIARKYALSADAEMRLVEMVAGWRIAAMDLLGERPWAVEVAYAYDPVFDLARTLPQSNGHRDYSSVEPGEFCGTADAVLLTSGSAHVIDWKTGRRSAVASAAENPQLNMLALCVARAHGLSEVIVSLAWVAEDGTVDLDTAVIGSAGLAYAAAEMHDLHTRLSSTAEPSTGPYCRYCPIATQCPATTRALQTVIPATPIGYRIVASREELQSAEHASWQLHMVRAIERALEQANAALKAYADQNGGIDCGNGQVWARRDVQSERIDLDAESAARLEALVPGATKASATKASIKAAAKASGKAVAPTEREAMDLLRSMGAVRTSVTSRYEETKRK